MSLEAAAKRTRVIRVRVDELPDDVLVLEPRLIFDSALLGYTERPVDHWPRKENGQPVAVYSRAKCLVALEKWLECSAEEAEEWYEYNTAGARVGEGTPVFVP